jgi:hypothetical protein
MGCLVTVGFIVGISCEEMLAGPRLSWRFGPVKPAPESPSAPPPPPVLSAPPPAAPAPACTRSPAARRGSGASGGGAGYHLDTRAELLERVAWTPVLTRSPTASCSSSPRGAGSPAAAPEVRARVEPLYSPVGGDDPLRARRCVVARACCALALMLSSCISRAWCPLRRVRARRAVGRPRGPIFTPPRGEL